MKSDIPFHFSGIAGIWFTITLYANNRSCVAWWAWLLAVMLTLGHLGSVYYLLYIKKETCCCHGNQVH